MKKKIFLMILFIVNCLMMNLSWFQNMGNKQWIYGTIMLENPIALTCLLLIVIGIYIKRYYSYVITSIGWIGYISMQIYEFLTWHMKVNGGSFDLGLSFDLCFNEFYLAILISVLSWLIFRYVLKQKEYEVMYKTTLRV